MCKIFLISCQDLNSSNELEAPSSLDETSLSLWSLPPDMNRQSTWSLSVSIRCGTLPVCTVTGSSVIDFHGRLVSIQDRCGYALMKPQQGSDFGIHAGFLERRRKDVSHLDHLLIVQSNKTFALGQGGTVVVS